MTLEWKDSYKIGYPGIDAQHQHLFELTNALLATDDVPTLQRLVMELYKHTREHFEAEEALMRQCKFPDVAAHTNYHNELLRRLNDVSQQLGQGVFDRPALALLMSDWAQRHIPHDDAPIAQFIKRAP